MAVTLTASAIHAQERIGAFRYAADVDALTDVDRSYVTTTELNPTLLRQAQLFWRCNGSFLDLYLYADEFLNSNDNVPIQWRFDREPAAEGRMWQVSTNGQAVFASRTDVVAFTEAARPASSVLLRVTDFRGVDHDLSFSMNGLTAALQRLRCRADLEPPAGKAPAEAWQTALVPEGMHYAGNPATFSFAPTALACWTEVVSRGAEIFFRTAQEARRAGFAPNTFCRDDL